jgi:hypothetical protein
MTTSKKYQSRYAFVITLTTRSFCPTAAIEKRGTLLCYRGHPIGSGTYRASVSSEIGCGGALSVKVATLRESSVQYTWTSSRVPTVRLPLVGRSSTAVAKGWHQSFSRWFIQHSQWNKEDRVRQRKAEHACCTQMA